MKYKNSFDVYNNIRKIHWEIQELWERTGVASPLSSVGTQLSWGVKELSQKILLKIIERINYHMGWRSLILVQPLSMKNGKRNSVIWDLEERIQAERDILALKNNWFSHRRRQPKITDLKDFTPTWILSLTNPACPDEILQKAQEIHLTKWWEKQARACKVTLPKNILIGEKIFGISHKGNRSIIGYFVSSTNSVGDSPNATRLVLTKALQEEQLWARVTTSTQKLLIKKFLSEYTKQYSTFTLEEVRVKYEQFILKEKLKYGKEPEDFRVGFIPIRKEISFLPYSERKNFPVLTYILNNDRNVEETAKYILDDLLHWAERKALSLVDFPAKFLNELAKLRKENV